MSASIYAKQLRTAADELIAAMQHLKFSRDSVGSFDGADSIDDLSPEALEKIEAFTSRFARVVDLLIHRVLRSIDFYELQEPGTLLDVANRAEGRGLIVSVDWLRIPYPIGILGGYCFDLLAKVTGKKLPISSIRVKKFCSSTEINSDKLDQSGFVRPVDFKEGLQRTLTAEFGG